MWFSGGRRSIYGLRVAALLAVVTLTACGQLPGDGSQPPREPADWADAVDCTAADPLVEPEEQADAPALAAGGVPEGFVPVEAVRCDTFMMATLEDEEGLWSAVTEERLAGNIDALVDALAEPSDPPRANQACTADMELVPDLWLVDAQGQAMRAAWPTNSCGKTKPGVREALDGMDVVESTQHKIKLIQPRAALDANCPAEWKEPVAVGIAVAPIPAPDLGAEGTGATVPGSAGVVPEGSEVDSLRICRYSVDRPGASAPPPTGPSAELEFSGTEVFTGEFVDGGSLDGPAKNAVLKAATADAPAAECDDEAAEFAVLWPVAGGLDVGAPLTAELDGCQRLFGPDGTARTMPHEASTAVVVALEK
jgi:hypothetical protein